MRLFYFFIIFSFLLYSQTVFAEITVSSISTNCAVTATLRVGSRGTEVQCLQVKVGAVADGIFGPLTNIAVLTFQSSNGLVADGIVGPLTRSVLNDQSSLVLESLEDDVDLGSAISDDNKVLESSVDSAENTESIKYTNPNLINLDQFIETVVEVNRDNGLSEEELQIIIDALREAAVSSNINFREEFEKLLSTELSFNLSTQPTVTIWSKIVAKTFSFLGITPSIAQAQIGIPFGGALIYSFFCAANLSWMIGIQPLPPTFVVLLTYYPGTQGFASYNIPFTRFLLGSYTPIGVCLIPAVPVPIPIPTEGTITPMVGSSPL